MFGGFWRRVLAYLIDSLVLSLLLMTIYVFAIMLFGFHYTISLFTQSLIINESNFMEYMREISVLCIIGNVTMWLYFALFEASTIQGTPGKLLLGMKVTDLNGNRISFRRATGRYFSKIISGFVFYIGFLMIAFTERKRGLHDKIAGTIITKERYIKIEQIKNINVQLIKELEEGKIKNYREVQRRKTELQGSLKMLRPPY